MVHENNICIGTITSVPHIMHNNIVLGPIPSKDLNGKHKQITSMLMNITNMFYNILEQK